MVSIQNNGGMFMLKVQFLFFKFKFSVSSASFENSPHYINVNFQLKRSSWLDVRSNVVNFVLLHVAIL